MSAARKVKCKCGQVLAINTLAECTVQCPTCKKTLRVPASKPAPSAPANQQAAAQQAAAQQAAAQQAAAQQAAAQQAAAQQAAAQQAAAQQAAAQQQQAADPFGATPQGGGFSSAPNPAFTNTAPAYGGAGAQPAKKSKGPSKPILFGAIGLAALVLIGIAAKLMLGGGDAPIAKGGGDPGTSTTDSDTSTTGESGDIWSAPAKTSGPVGGGDPISDDELPAEGATIGLSRSKPTTSLALTAGGTNNPMDTRRVVFGDASGAYKLSKPVVLDASAQMVAVSITKDKKTKIHGANLKSGEAALLHEHDGPMFLLDHFGNNSLLWEGLDVLSRGGSLRIVTGLKEGKPETTFRRPMPGNAKPGFKPTCAWGRILPGNKLAAVIESNFYIWNTADGSLLAHVELKSNEVPDINAARRFIALPQSGGAGVIDAMNVKEVGFVPFVDDTRPLVRFLPNQSTLSLHTAKTMRLWDLQANKVIQDTTMPYHVSGEIHWVADNLYYSKSGYLCRVDDRTAAWRYNANRAEIGGSANGTVLLAGARNVLFVQNASVPDPAGTDALAKLGSGGSEYIVMGPGSKVKLNVTAAKPLTEADMRSQLVKQVESAGWSVADSASAVLTVTFTKGENKTVDYRKLGAGRGDSQQVAVQVYDLKYDLKIAGESVYEYQTTTMPFGLVVQKPGQSMADAANEKALPSASHLYLSLPKYLPAKEYRYGLGTSTLKDGEWVK